MSDEAQTPAKGRPYGLMARFKSAEEIYHAAERVRDEGYQRWDVFTPFPVHGMDDAMGLKRSKVPRATFVGGITGFTTGVLIVWYMNSFDYPLIVGGKPYFSMVFPFPVFYELNILLAAFGTFLGMFISNLLPRHNHPSFNHPSFDKASDDAFFLLLQRDDPKFNESRGRELLESIGGTEVQLVNDA
ncbi:MAG: DUF3341 domain-containing protein [Opitutales bacterium]